MRAGGGDGNVLKRSLFSPVYQQELNNDEQAVAVYLDSDETLKWWHRNVRCTPISYLRFLRKKTYPE